MKTLPSLGTNAELELLAHAISSFTADPWPRFRKWIWWISCPWFKLLVSRLFMTLQGVVLLRAAAANSWRLFKGWKKKTDVSLDVFKKMQQSYLSDLKQFSSCFVWFCMLSMSNHLEWFIVESCPQHCLHYKKKSHFPSFTLFHKSWKKL